MSLNVQPLSISSYFYISPVTLRLTGTGPSLLEIQVRHQRRKGYRQRRWPRKSRLSSNSLGETFLICHNPFQKEVSSLYIYICTLHLEYFHDYTNIKYIRSSNSWSSTPVLLTLGFATTRSSDARRITCHSTPLSSVSQPTSKNTTRWKIHAVLYTTKYCVGVCSNETRGKHLLWIVNN